MFLNQEHVSITYFFSYAICIQDGTFVELHMAREWSSICHIFDEMDIDVFT